MRTLISALILLTTASSVALETKAPPDMPTVPFVELNSYLGLWYEIRRIENSFQDNDKKGEGVCYNTTAEYSLLSDGKIQVKNTCYRKTYSEVAKAKARVVKDSNNSKLKVNFTGLAFLEWLRIGDGDYWILDLGPLDENGQYSWALVGEKKRKYGWILSRTPELHEQALNAALETAESVGYDLSKFKEFKRE